ncbi:hypothetical protein [Thermostichus vulcanus]|nr:hypothetical protein [Thermostichus vulcanus]
MSDWLDFSEAGSQMDVDEGSPLPSKNQGSCGSRLDQNLPPPKP